MYKIVTEPYCNGCPYFKSRTIMTYQAETTEIHCKDEKKCKRLADFIFDRTLIRIIDPENTYSFKVVSLRELLNQKIYSMEE